MRTHITVSGMFCVITQLPPRSGFQRETGHPKAEVHAPDGYEFSGGETVLCIHSASDLDEIERGETLNLINPEHA